MAGCCKLLAVGILCSCSCQCKSVYSAFINLRKDRCFSVFCNFLSLYERKSVVPLNVRALRMGYSLYFRL